MAEEPAWKSAAFEVYRLGRPELDIWRLVERRDLEYWVDELQEALLDLKQATVESSPGRALQHVTEVALLVAELRTRGSGG